MRYLSKQSGFTAVELLITLFVAAAFLVASYQLFNVVIKDGGSARAESRASNVAYDYMRRYTNSATIPCSASTPLNNSAIDIDGLTDVTITVAITCLPDTVDSVTKIDVTIAYNLPQQILKYSTYVNGSSAPSTDITDGLLSWWKFNGDADTAVGTDNGTITNAIPTQGQDGLENTAFAFNGTNAKLNMPLTSLPATMSEITISVWLKPTVAASTSVFIANADDTANRLNLHLPFTGNAIYWDFGNISTTGRVSGATTFQAGWLNNWALYTVTSGASTGQKVYRNGSVILTSATASSFSKGTKTLEVGAYSGGGTFWTGSMDDMRIYSRVLTTQEVLSLYNAGAK